MPIVEAVGTITGEICHIRARNEGGPRFDVTQSEDERQSFANLVLLCRRHHKMVDAEPDVYSAEALEEIKRLREEEMGRPEEATDAFYAKILLSDLRRIEVTNNSGNVVIDSPGAIIAATVNVKSARKTVKIQPAAGTIGADLKASRYIQYLISRYNKFASADKSRDTKFSYGAITKNIEANFSGPWRMLAIEDFDALCTYLQRRISRTRIAKANAAKGLRAFSSFEDYAQTVG
ncbi:hypothetical protein AA13595_0261 [Gluconacetobacter johannae DSM 13595]|uniref:HNH endonuclease signature motif containing protein n=1 Tax=Gluconacetobacter johannae TaxID=112140 RepID=UPI001C80A950|nr:HNH endonuclease signature motif containing protein [Gluconacetobacter johannae]GBQ80183.1 hypothetical protein AA13595_0261 [Gluconacetobacter johannae DSM 13595]